MAAKAHTLADLEASLAAGNTAPLYFFHGEQDTGISQAVRMVRAHMQKAGDPSTAWRAYDLSEQPFADFISDVLTVSFFSEKRGVILQGLMKRSRGKAAGDQEGAEEEKGAKDLRLDEKELEALQKYIATPSPDVSLVIAPGKPDMRQKFWKELAASAYTISFTFTDADRKLLIEQRLQSSGFQFVPDARMWMEDRFVANFALLESEMNKLALYMGETKRVTLQDLETCMSAPSQDTVFKLTDALASRDVGTALRALESLRAGGEPVQLVMGMVARQFRLLLMVREGKDERRGDEEIAAKAGLRTPFPYRIYSQQAQKFSAPALKRIIVSLARADLRMRGGAMNEWFVLEQELVGIISPPAARKGV